MTSAEEVFIKTTDLVLLTHVKTRSSAVAVIADRTAYRAYGAPYE